MAKQFYGSINLTKLIALGKAGHPSIVKAKNGDVYVNIQIWENDSVDDYGNIISVNVTPSKEERETKAKRTYIGNLKPSESNEPEQAKSSDIDDSWMKGDSTDGNTQANGDDDPPF